ncbi:MAG: GTPase HflX [Candidatus Omnitrophica bacterium]|nr:GTPase HflX [Candidatus Omnitrophota bacterium]
MERSLLITVDFKKHSHYNVELAKQELRQLAKTALATSAAEVICQRDKPDPAYFLGKGKVEELAELITENQIDTVIFNNDLSSSQQRNLEERLGVKTIDRTQLILDIFAQHARSQEGSLQIELAQLEYLLPRLTGKGTMLSRLGGGIGTRGPGEKKLEVDRRRIRQRIGKLKKDLQGLRTHRQNLRKKRLKETIPVIALVGYTNSGKSTLINTLTKADQVVRDSLFTTLDPLSRSAKFKNHQKFIFSDTVGFLDRLPHGLIEAFKATLEEVKQAQLLIHVLDISFGQYAERAQAVNRVLDELQVQDKPLITALNKIDRLEDRTWLGRLKRDFKNPVAISAASGEGLEELKDLITAEFSCNLKNMKLSLPLDKMHVVDLIYREGNVEDIRYTQREIEINANLPLNLAEALKGYEKK